MIGQPGVVPAIPAPGFADPTREAQLVFRAVLDALSHPGRAYPIDGIPEAPEDLGPGLGAVALTLLDEETSVWRDGPLGDDDTALAWLAFHTGVRRAPLRESAEFVLARPFDLGGSIDFIGLAVGTEEAPHRSATVLLDVRDCSGLARFRAEGPGIDGSVEFDAPWADDAFLDRWTDNNRLFPRGVDLVLVGEAGVSALSRTTRLTIIDHTSREA